MSRVTLIQHINIQISNRERTREWYEQVLGAEFLDRGPEANRRQLQLRIGNGEIHTTDNPHPNIASSVHFAVEIDDWDEIIHNLDKLGVAYTTRPGSRTGTGGENSWGQRDYSGGHYTYVHDPDGNMIELVHHPLGLEDAAGNRIDVRHYHESPRWGKFKEYSGTAT
jgi:catechol 2,3-dioxygenase-like lactoylglutathione lyase family enzyme